jgi:hypothetical protein
MMQRLDFAFNPKIYRSLVFDLATGGFIAIMNSRSGTGKGGLAPSNGQAAIMQAHRVLYREAQVLLADLHDNRGRST